MAKTTSSKPLFFYTLLGLCVLLPTILRAGTIRLVVYNARNYQVEAPASSPELHLKDPAARTALARFLADQRPDLVGLMEMGGSPAVLDLQKQLEKFGWPMPESIVVPGEDALRQLALLSRLPLRDRSRTDLRFVHDGTWAALQRGLLHAEVEVAPGAFWQVLGVHWKSQREVPGLDQEGLRLMEAITVRGELDRLFTELTLPDQPDQLDPAIILWGDLNETRRDPGFRAILGPRNSSAALHPLDLVDEMGDRWTHLWRDAEQYSRIDFVFVSKALRGQVDLAASGILRPPDWEMISDHRPLLVEFKVEE